MATEYSIRLFCDVIQCFTLFYKCNLWLFGQKDTCKKNIMNHFFLPFISWEFLTGKHGIWNQTKNENFFFKLKAKLPKPFYAFLHESTYGFNVIWYACSRMDRKREIYF